MVTNTLYSPHVAGVLNRLFNESDASEPAREAIAQSDVARLLQSRTGYREFYGRMKDIPLPVSRETGYLLYMLARSTRARHVLEFGTSFGVSTIYLAAALRDNRAAEEAAPDGDRLLSPEHLHELVPDIAERDVYVCGPPGMTDFAVRNVRDAGVPHSHIHVERFAL